jgi:uncharacterized protein (TIGR02246 family)
MDPEDAYRRLLQAWNSRDAAAFASVFTNPCSCVGYDGTEYTSPDEAEEALRTIFADHQVADYVWLVRSAHPLANGVVLVRAVAGMVSPDNGELVPDRHVVHNVVAVRTPSGWQIASYQNTPARYDGRPEAVQALTAELTAAL